MQLATLMNPMNSHFMLEDEEQEQSRFLAVEELHGYLHFRRERG